jgi:hypothetical protein
MRTNLHCGITAPSLVRVVRRAISVIARRIAAGNKESSFRHGT